MQKDHAAVRNANTLWIDSNIAREILVIGFSAVMIALSGAYLHSPVRMPGHRVLPLVFFLLLGRSGTRSRGAATVIGLFAGVFTLPLGLGFGAWTHTLKYFIGGGLLDALVLLWPAVVRSRWLGAVAGAALGATWFPMTLVLDRLLGLNIDLVLRIALLKVASAMLFGVLGGALAVTVARPLRTRGFLPAD